MSHSGWTNIRIGSYLYPMEIASTLSDIARGMTKFNTPPSHGMIFLISGRAMDLTMDGMRFPLDILFLSQDEKILQYRRAYPNDLPWRMPQGTYYMLEFPLGMLDL